MRKLSTDLPGKVQVRGRGHFNLTDPAASKTHGWNEARAHAATLSLAGELDELQYKLHADGRYGVLAVLQAIDGGGRDSTIRHVFSACNPQGCSVHAFKTPTSEEVRHDYLWRVHPHVPSHGEIAVFNHSQWQAYRQAFGDMLGRCNTSHAHWYVVPADHKWLRDLAVSQIMCAALRSLPLRFPPPRFNPRVRVT